MKKILTVVGARPQFIKAALVSRALRKARGLREVLVHTGQHYDKALSRVFFRELGLPRPRVNLGVGSAPHGAQTGRMLEALERVMSRERPAWVLVYGDTNSTLAGALAAAKLGVPVAHVEAGLRSWNRAMPEELNRVLTDHASDLLFAPTTSAVANLRREGIAAARIVRTGDVMYDAALHYCGQAERSSSVLRRLALEPGGYVLATVHRAENTDDPARLNTIFEALNRLARDIAVVVPLHPRTRLALARLRWRAGAGLRVIDPVGYLDMVMLESRARLIATDSGGIQKEAYFYRVPCATLRTETEWVELTASGWNALVPPASADRVYRRLRSLLEFRPPAGRMRPYGEGRAAEVIARQLQVR
jgi:UDP-GlcNAc3NAcA epimerase